MPPPPPGGALHPRPPAPVPQLLVPTGTPTPTRPLQSSPCGGGSGSARQANMERELELELQRVEAQGAALEGEASPAHAPAAPRLGGEAAVTGSTPLTNDPRIQAMVARYPFINTAQITLIFKNDFRAVNIFKLVNDHIPNPTNKGLRLTRAGELRAHEEDAMQQDLKSMVPFLRCIGIYIQCLIEAVNDHLKIPLQASLAWYVDYLEELHLYYTFESI